MSTGGKQLLLLNLVLAGAASVSAAQPARWNLREIAAIGSADTGAASFQRISSVVADAHRNFYVAERAAQQIRAFDDRGRHLWTAGRRGQGPGEFTRISGLAWFGDTLS
jgi:hypothetical protein